MNKKKLLGIAVVILAVMVILGLISASETEEKLTIYNCEDNYQVQTLVKGSNLLLTIPGGSEYQLKAIESDSGNRYRNQSQTEFWEQGDEAVVKVEGVTLYTSCIRSVDNGGLGRYGQPSDWTTWQSSVQLNQYFINLSYPQGTVVTELDSAVILENLEKNTGFTMQVVLNSGLVVPANIAAEHNTDPDIIRFNGNEAYSYAIRNDANEVEQILDIILDENTWAKVVYSASDDRFTTQAIGALLNSVYFSQEEVSNDDNNIAPEVSKIKLAFLQDAAGSSEFGCDDVAMIERDILPTTKPLTAALELLFSIDEEVVAGANHFIASTNNTLQFDRAIVIEGVAHIYLSGALSGVVGVCDNPRAETQIIQTAKQFDTVDEVVLYLNGTAVEHLYDIEGARG